MSEKDIFEALADFMKGKVAPPDANMAKVKWDGDAAPPLPDFHASSKNYQDYASEYRLTVIGLSQCQRSASLAAIGAMLTLPELQSNCYRLEVLAHLAARFSNGKARPSTGQICAWFNQLDKGTCGRQEDAAEDVFLSNVHYENLNYRLFEGVVEANAFHTQLFLDAVEEMPNTGAFQSLKNSIRSILTLSDVIAERAQLPRNIVGRQTPIAALEKPQKNVFREIKQRVVFDAAQLGELGIQVSDLRPFTFDTTTASELDEAQPGRSPFEARPLIQDGNKIIVAIPSRIGIAIRRLVIEGCIQRSIADILEASLARKFAATMAADRLLGELPRHPSHMARCDGFYASDMTIEADPGRYLHLLMFTDGFSGYEAGGFIGMNPIKPISDFIEESLSHTKAEFSSRPGFKEGLSLVIGCGWGRSIGFKMPKGGPSWNVLSIPAHDLQTLGNHSDFRLLDIFRVVDALKKTENTRIHIVNVNGLLNLYGWMHHKNGHLIPHEDLDSDFDEDRPIFLNIPQNSLLGIRADVAMSTDKHLVERPDGTTVLVQRLNGSPRYGATSLSPFYVDLKALESKNFACVFIGECCRFWIETFFPESIPLATKHQLASMINNWSEITFRRLASEDGERVHSAI